LISRTYCNHFDRMDKMVVDNFTTIFTWNLDILNGIQKLATL